MLKNCILPVNYTKTQTQTCGEIICENLQEFIINCKLCKIKIFEFQEFIEHFKNVHLEGNFKGNKTTKPIKQKAKAEQEENYENIVKLEIITDVEETKSCDTNEKDDDFEWSIKNNDEDNDYEPQTSEDENEDYGEEEEEELSKTVLIKPRKPKEFACDMCNKKYTEHRRLQVHKTLMHLREKPFKCNQCDKSFAEQRYLTNHTRSEHIGFECPTCHKTFKTNPNLKKHLQVHDEKREFICTETDCGKVFSTKETLRVHQRYHKGELFICDECGFKCRKKDSLIVHKRHHTGEKPFACELCTSRFGSKMLLKEHMACHETERKHVCDVCGKSFNRPKALYHHKHLHLGIKKFVCKICGQAYAQAAGLSAHMRKHRENVNACSPDDNSMNMFYAV